MSHVEIKFPESILVIAVSSGVISRELAIIYLTNSFSPISETFKVMNISIIFKLNNNKLSAPETTRPFNMSNDSVLTIDADNDNYTWLNSIEIAPPGSGHNESVAFATSFSCLPNGTYDPLTPDNYLVTDKRYNIGKFSQLRLFGDKEGSTEKGLAANGATFQVGADAGANNTIVASGELFKSVEFSALTGASKFNLSDIANGQYGQNDKAEPTEANAYDKAIQALDEAINDISNRKSIIGSAGNRMDSALQTLTTQYENLSSAKSIITDADIAAEASTFVQNQILQQVSTSLLSQANQAPSIALSLI